MHTILQSYSHLYHYIHTSNLCHQQILKDFFSINDQIKLISPSIIKTSNTIKKITTQLSVETSKLTYASTLELMRMNIDKMAVFSDQLRQLSDDITEQSHTINSEINAHITQIETIQLSVRQLNQMNISDVIKPEEIKKTLSEEKNQQNALSLLNKQVLLLQEFYTHLIK